MSPSDLGTSAGQSFLYPYSWQVPPANPGPVSLSRFAFISFSVRYCGCADVLLVHSSRIQHVPAWCRKLELMYGPIWCEGLGSNWCSCDLLQDLPMTSSIFPYFLWHHSLALATCRIRALGTFLNVLVGKPFGFFVSPSTHRWHVCDPGFMELLEAVRCMQMQMTATSKVVTMLEDLQNTSWRKVKRNSYI